MGLRGMRGGSDSGGSGFFKVRVWGPRREYP